MITKLHSHYLKFLSQGYNILLLSDQHFNEYIQIQDDFDTGCQRNLTQPELDNLTFTLANNNIDIVLLDFSKNSDMADSFHKAIVSYNSRIEIIGIVEDDNKSLNIIKKLDSFLFKSFTLEELKNRLFITLSVYYTIKAAGRRDMQIETGSSELSNELDSFFDMYEGSSLFIVDELVELNSALKNGELSAELIQNISSKISEVGSTFSANEKTSEVASIFNNLAAYLYNLDLSAIEPRSLHAFNYLCNIIDDTNRNLMDMFVDRLFKDAYMFEHSLESNIGFMKDALAPDSEKNDESELEFF